MSCNIKNKMLKERIIVAVVTIISLMAIFVLLAIIGLILIKGIGVINLKFLTSITSFDFYGVPRGGIGPAILGTLYVSLLALTFSIPLGVLGGIFLSEYRTKNKIFSIMRMGVANLAGVPSVVHGLFGIAFFVVLLKFGLSILSSALTLSILSLPIIIISTETAMKNVSENIREGAFALGAKRWQSALLVVAPAAFPKIITGIIMASARITGETAPILFTGATLYLTFYPHGLNEQFMSLPYMIWGLSTTSINIEVSTPFAYGIAIVLIIVVALMNTGAMIFRYIYRKKYTL